MQYIDKTESYNEKRYGKPWLAIVTTSLTKNFDFIDWSGRWGCAGEFVFDAAPGTMLAYGQKDLRKNRGGVYGYQICMPDGSIPVIPDSWAAEIRKLASEFRWVRAAEMLLTKNVEYYRNGPKDTFGSTYYASLRASAMEYASSYAKMLGVQSPIMADIADALGLIDHPAPAQSPTVSMESFF